jgi:hypothetical protein
MESKKLVRVKQEATPKGKDKHPEINVDEYVELMVFEFKNKNGEEYIEAHIDMIANYDDMDDVYLQNSPFGGNLSVRKPPHVKPLVVFGQDEAIYRSTSLCPTHGPLMARLRCGQKEVAEQ